MSWPLPRRLRVSWSPLRSLHSARRQVVDDLRADPYLPYLLVLATLLASFWIWHRLPNFATRDERWRVADPIQPVGFFLDDGDLASIREGVVFWRSYGGTFYVYGLVLAPVVLFVLVASGPSPLVDVAHHSIADLWGHWQDVPAPVWTATVLLARLCNVLFAVGSVYVLYRTGTMVRDRSTGRLAGLLLSLTWGVLILAHEAGEDVPALFFFLLSVYFALRYVDSGSRRTFYWGCLWGGLAAGFKFTAGVSALLLGVALLLRAGRTDGSWRETLFSPRFVLTGMAVGAVAIVVSYPSVLVGAPDQFGGRLERGLESKGSPHGWRIEPSWWWILRGYLHGLGLPLSLAAVAGVVASLGQIREQSRAGDAVRLSLAGVAAFLVAYAPWAYVRTHHLLFTFPLLVLLVALGVDRLSEARPTLARLTVAFLLVTTGAYAVGGDLGYAAQARDEAGEWLLEDSAGNATVETYVKDPQDAAVPHGMPTNDPGDRRAGLDGREVPLTLSTWTVRMPDRCPDYIVLNYQRSLLQLAPENHSHRASLIADPYVAEYLNALLTEDEYPYEVVGRFGRRPRFLDDREPLPPWRRMLRVGIRPRTAQYGDPQDFGVQQYTVVLERTGACTKD